MLRAAAVDGVGDLEHGHVDAVGDHGDRDPVARGRAVERARQDKPRVSGAGAPHGSGQPVRDLLGSDAGGPRKAPEDAGVRAVEHDLREIGGGHPGVRQGAAERLDQERRVDVGAEALLPLLGEGHSRALPDVEHLFRAGGAADQPGDRFRAVAAEDERRRGVAAAGLARTARRADDHVAGRDQDRAARRRHVDAGEQGRQTGAGRTAQVERGDRLGQVRRRLQGRGVQLLGVRCAGRGEGDRVHFRAFRQLAERLARGFHRHRGGVFVVAGGSALAAAEAHGRPLDAVEGYVAAVADDSGHGNGSPG